MRLIQLTRGKFAMVDDDDYGKISAHRWCAQRQGRDGFSAARRGPGHDGVQGPYIYMHRAIMGAAKGDAVDHKNGDPLDNRKENLRIATQQENMRNKVRKPPNCTSKYKGVYWHRSMKKWAAEIRDCELLPSGKTRKRVIGYFSAEEDAARAYDAAASASFGEFAAINFRS